MSLFIEDAGILTTIQDRGRYGYQDIGVSPAGPMDASAFNIANLLVGNEMGLGALETTYLGPSILFEEDCAIAITGADMMPTVDDMVVPMYTAISVLKGQRLKLRQLKNGLRSYIAFAGGFDMPYILGSQSTLIRNAFGGYQGRALKAGDRIPLKSPKAILPKMEDRNYRINNCVSGRIVLRAIKGPQDMRFSKAGIETFFGSEYAVTNEFDRMGYRLDGPVIEHLTDANIISDGIVAGSVQVPGNGLPIVMMTDRQSTGGYTKIATVISTDLPKMAQAKPGDKILFKEIDIRSAQKLYIEHQKALKQMASKWKI